LKKRKAEERMLVAIFLCNKEAGDWQLLFEKDWLENWQKELVERIKYVGSIYEDFSINDIFPWADELSEGIEKSEFLVSHFIQPDLFLRIRKGHEKLVTKKLQDGNVEFTVLENNALTLANSSKVDGLIEIDKEAVIQDLSSQRIAEYFPIEIQNSKFKIQNTQLQSPPGLAGTKLQTKLWDCCAASGGKSILAIDVLNNVDLTVSDIRHSILKNLKERFERAGIKKYQSFTADLTTSTFDIQHSTFDIILCDAPCSGSGTWGRTPEQLCFFKTSEISEYASLQKKIVGNVISKVSPGGHLLYITCSVFKKENEEMVDWIKEEYPFEVVRSGLLKGYDCKADSMFAALLKHK
jgi:16S rRNA (cytosine967-C5)-methyltransferase